MAPGGRNPGKPSTKIIIYAIIGIIAVVAAISYPFILPTATSPALPSTGGNDNERLQQLLLFESNFCGKDARANSNSYITEVLLPSKCEMPVGIAVGSNEVWYLSSRNATLGNYDVGEGKFGKPHSISGLSTQPRETDIFGSGTVKLDRDGNVWFTSDRFANSIYRFEKETETFNRFFLPGNNSNNFPISFDFDSNGETVYIAGIRSTSLFMGDISNMQNGTSSGINEIPLPIEEFSGIDKFLISSGSVAVDNARHAVWIPILAFQQKGEVARYDIITKTVKVFDMPPDLSSPVSAVVDDSGNVWVTNHAASIFFKLDPESGKITRYATSIASTRIYGGGPKPPDNAYTLPYWFHKSSNGEIWFNEHTGNKMARFDTVSGRLVEYWIPSQNAKWVDCPADSTSGCGFANVLQFSLSPNDEVWFTEWSENKIGTLDSKKEIPISVSLEMKETTVQRGETAELAVDLKAAPSGFTGKMIASGTFTPTAGLGNSTGIFSEDSIDLKSGGSKQISFFFTPTQDLKPGSYTVMIGAENNEISCLIPVTINVT